MSLALRRGVANFTVALRTRIPRHQPFFGALGPTSRYRFSTSTTLRAQENPIFPNVEDANGTIPAKIRQVLENPELVAAINNLNTVAKEEGMQELPTALLFDSSLSSLASHRIGYVQRKANTVIDAKGCNEPEIKRGIYSIS